MMLLKALLAIYCKQYQMLSTEDSNPIYLYKKFDYLLKITIHYAYTRHLITRSLCLELVKQSHSTWLPLQYPVGLERNIKPTQ